MATRRRLDAPGGVAVTAVVSSAPRVVLKLGGEIVADAQSCRRIVAEVARQWDAGWRMLVVHGGGPQIASLQTRLGQAPRKVAGRRVTDRDTLDVAKQALAGEVNVDLVALARAEGLPAVGLSGVSFVEAVRRQESADVDYGWVGRIVEVDSGVVEGLWDAGYVPVVAPLGRASDARGEVYNINADAVAAGIAQAVAADHLFLVSSVDGVLAQRSDPASRIPRLTAAEARAAIDEGVIVDGMIPKVLEAIERLAGTGAVAHIVGPGVGSLSEAAEHPGRYGTALCPD